ncbi:MAG: hypothetical protein V4508_26450 [Pseudomonadota bacterium]
MTNSFTFARPDRRGLGLAATALLHLLLIAAWLHARHAATPDGPGPARIQWVRIAPPAPPAAPTPVRMPLAHHVAPSIAATRPPFAMAPIAPEAAPAAVPAAAPALNHDQWLKLAKESIGQIDQQLRAAKPGQPITAPASTPQTRLAKGINDAADAAPNRWFEAPKVTEIIDPGGYGRRRYRVVGALATYCITIESNHAPDGLDVIKNGSKPKITNCEANETAPTRQKW